MLKRETPETICIFNALTGEVQKTSRIEKTAEEWKNILTPQQYAITRLKDTEQPRCTSHDAAGNSIKGVYRCVCCKTDLFLPGAKFESGTGWPSFLEPVSDLNIREQPDNTYGMSRTEISCARCDAHLGHMFLDGPPPERRRYCINSGALKFFKTAQKFKKPEKAAFAAGCFWGVEASFRKIPGVINTAVGYMGGTTENPTYEDVCRGDTGHAETVRVEYDEDKVSYKKLLEVFWSIHDPTTPDRQGFDIGTQYRSAIFFYTSEQEKAALASLKKVEKSGKWDHPVVTNILPAEIFYRAEEYHQHYYEKGLR